MVPETYYIISRSGAPSLQQMKTGYDVMKTMHCKACNYVLVRLVRPFLRFITHSFCILKVKIDLRHFYYVLMDFEQTEVIGSLSLDLKSLQIAVYHLEGTCLTMNGAASRRTLKRKIEFVLSIESHDAIVFF